MDQPVDPSPCYVLEQNHQGLRKTLPLTEHEFVALKLARDVLFEALEFEQRYELLVGNFIQMELYLTELCLRSTIEPQYEYSDIARVIQETNRHIGNLLTAARSYIDQVKQDFKALPLSPSFAESAKTLLSAQYDGSIEYRFMEALRNYTQHRAFPATGFSGSLILNQDPNGWVESVVVSAKKDEVFADKKFKRNFLEELPQKIDLRHYSREYVRGLGKAHVALRALVQRAITESRSLIDATTAMYRGSEDHPTLALSAKRLAPEAEVIPLLTNWDEVRVALAQKNSKPADLWPRARTGELSAAELRALREKAGQTIEQAAGLVFVSPARWEQYESGLKLPEAIHVLYKLQTGQHHSHEIASRKTAANVDQDKAPDGQSSEK